MNRIANLALSVLALTPAMAAARGSSSGGNVRRVELNAFYGMATVSPSGVNDNVTDYNAQGGISAPLSKVSNSTLMGGELMYNFSPMFGLGVSFMQQSSSSGTATLSGTTNEYKTQISDGTLVARYQWPTGIFAFQFGVSGGTSLTFKTTAPSAGTNVQTEYTAGNVIVGRAFLGGRWNLGWLAIFVQGGYQMANAPELKDAAGNKFVRRSTGTATGVDMSGGFALGGIGLQF